MSGKLVLLDWGFRADGFVIGVAGVHFNPVALGWIGGGLFMLGFTQLRADLEKE